MTTYDALGGNESATDPDAARQGSTVSEAGRPVVVITGEVDLGCAGDVGRALETARHAQHGDLIVDLSAVEFIDASGLKPLLVAHRELTDEGRRLALRAPSAATVRLLAITGLEHVFSRTTDDG